MSSSLWRPSRRALLMSMGALALPRAAFATASSGTPLPGLSLYGQLKHATGFTHFDYVNPAAPKGGSVKFESIGTYDTLNPYTLKGVPAAGVNYHYDTLLANAPNEPVTAYGLIAETVAVAPDKLSVLYTIRKEARFHDGKPVTAEDVAWTFATLKTKGHPKYRLYYADVVKAEVEGGRGVRFTFRTAENRELPQIVGEMPVLSKAYWGSRDFTQTTLEPPVGSGPYKIDKLEAGRSITYR
ncbi:MAG: ABC transporter substrate-binding protein, partial [Stellaceae bacterium]